MKKYLFLLIIMLSCSFVNGQDNPAETTGRISYQSSKNVYVTFESTLGISSGDTLFTRKGSVMMPVLLIKNLSSMSCLCEPLTEEKLEISQEVIHRSRKAREEVPDVVPGPEVEDQPEVIQQVPTDSPVTRQDSAKPAKGEVNGRISISSYSGFSDQEGTDYQRMRYVFALSASEIAGSKLSFDSYISFRHGSDNWNDLQDNIYNGLKVYNLSLYYNINEDMDLWLGRRINPKLSSMGAIDGLQYEYSFGAFSAGIIAGSRPDWEDYSFNASLFQAGAYLNHSHAGNNAYLESTIAYVDQENDWNTDRRFLYVQHMNRLLGKLYFFGSAELDLYKYANDKKETTFRLTNLYLSLRYSLIRKLSVSFSYSARNNIILFETYKSFIDQLLELETLQGFILGITGRPAKYLSAGVRGSYRYRKEDLKPSKSLQVYANVLQSKAIPVSITLSATFLETSYIRGSEYGIRFSRDIIKGLYAVAGYRNTNYNYYSGEYSSDQHNLDLSLSYRAPWKLFLSINYEAILDDNYTFNRLYINLTKRF